MRTPFLLKRGAMGAVFVGALASTLLFGSMTTASAATANSAAPGQSAATAIPPSAITSPQMAAKAGRTPVLDWLGSQVAKHEPAQNAHEMIVPNAANTYLDGLDVSGYQTGINWTTVKNNGAKFAYAKATEGTYYTNPQFSNEYSGAYNVGIIHGAYHFATPDTTSGATQADYFVAHGGGWSADGKTLPGMLDMEWDPYGSACYGLSASSMVNWILSFSNEYHAKTSRWPVIYTATSWWSECTGNTGDFSSTNPLMLANYNGSPGAMPYHWGFETIWQYADSGKFPGDQDYFNGTAARLTALALNTP
jgi:GH25 family lysozyme M1 (1,4-beta-N-acetylmuramidase)